MPIQDLMKGVVFGEMFIKKFKEIGPHIRFDIHGIGWVKIQGVPFVASCSIIGWFGWFIF